MAWEEITGLNESELNFIHSGYHLGEEQGGLGTGGEDGGEVYYQPEPTLLTIASGEQGVVEEQVKILRQFRTTFVDYKVVTTLNFPATSFPMDSSTGTRSLSDSGTSSSLDPRLNGTPVYGLQSGGYL